MGIPDHLTCLLRNLCAGQEAAVRTGHGRGSPRKSGNCPRRSHSVVDLKRLLPGRAVAPRKRKSSESYPRKVRMDIFLVGHNLQRYSPSHPLEPNKNKNKFKKLIYFNWRLITLQYCSGFCHTLTWISYRCTCVPHPERPPPSPSHPSGSSQCTSPEHLVSCIEPVLAIYFTYDNIHVSMLLSQIIPPLPSPTESKSLFFTFVFLLLSRK